jgi:hypothetical protein
MKHWGVPQVSKASELSQSGETKDGPNARARMPSWESTEVGKTVEVRRWDIHSTGFEREE